MAWRRGVFLSLMWIPLAAASPANAGDPTPFDWRGFYLGYHLGGALDLAEIENPFGASIFGGTVRKPGPLAGGQAGYNWQHGATVFGIEADASWADLGGTNTCFAYSGNYVSANCRADVDALGTFTGRLGWALPGNGRTLIFGKAGLGWAHTELQATPNGDLGLKSTRESGTDWGWTVGGGVERALTARWTVKAEYDYLSLDNGFAAPRSLFQSAPPGPLNTSVNGAPAERDRDIHAFKIGMNYRLGPGRGPDMALDDDFPPPPKGYTLTAGGRYVYGWGQFHKDLGIQGEGLGSLASRLTYDNDDVSGGEAFARLDTPFGVVVKGLIGGAESGGSLNDEDWDLPFPGGVIAYSNTISAVDNEIGYGLVDVGYAVWRGAQHSVTPFVGYTQFHQDMTGLGCRQIANPHSDCVPAIPATIKGIREVDTWQGLRLGVAAETTLAPRMTLSGDAAYLPYVTFKGTDDHLLRNLLSPEQGRGTGVQLEATLSYALTDAFSLGVGGRYWSLWTTSGTVNFGGQGFIIPMRYAAEQAQLLVQGSYKFGFGAGD